MQASLLSVRNLVMSWHPCSTFSPYIISAQRQHQGVIHLIHINACRKRDESRCLRNSFGDRVVHRWPKGEVGSVGRHFILSSHQKSWTALVTTLTLLSEAGPEIRTHDKEVLGSWGALLSHLPRYLIRNQHFVRGSLLDPSCWALSHVLAQQSPCSPHILPYEF